VIVDIVSVEASLFEKRVDELCQEVRRELQTDAGAALLNCVAEPPASDRLVLKQPAGRLCEPIQRQPFHSKTAPPARRDRQCARLGCGNLIPSVRPGISKC